uniref:Uncharacterized protein n=1 Tax=viral metagenome TaxID=1070528 RepID=A0A6M3L0E0_9ZZZZ
MAYGDTPLTSAMIENTSKEGQNIAILGEHTDTNPNTIAAVLDGTTSATLGSAGPLTFLGTYQSPLILGTIRLWHDATNSVLRVKYGSAPSSETDGSPLMEG